MPLFTLGGILAPKESLENSVFKDVGHGRRYPNASLRTKIGWTVDFFLNTFLSVEYLAAYAPLVNYGMGAFFIMLSLALYGYFIGSTYTTTANTQFIALDLASGNCKTVPVAVTGKFTLDSNGYWSGETLFNPSQGMYHLALSNFQHSLEEYQSFMAYTRSVIETALSEPAQHRDLSYNLLSWVTWSLFITEGAVQHRWTMTGDAKTLLARQNYYGSLSKQLYDCQLPGNVTYNKATGHFTMAYSHDSFSKSENCKTILLDTDIGYNAIANGNVMSLEWDGVSLLLARAVNKGVISMSQLITAKSGGHRRTPQLIHSDKSHIVTPLLIH